MYNDVKHIKLSYSVKRGVYDVQIVYYKQLYKMRKDVSQKTCFNEALDYAIARADQYDCGIRITRMSVNRR